MRFKLKNILDFLLCLFLFLLPWQTAWLWREMTLNGAKWQYGTLAIYGTEILLWIIFIFQLFIWLKERKLKINIDDFQNINHQRIFFVFLVWLLVFWSGFSVIWSADKSLSFFSWFHFLEAVALFFIVLNNRFDLRKISWALVSAGTIQAVLVV